VLLDVSVIRGVTMLVKEVKDLLLRKHFGDAVEDL
jgi:hypothetical protein